MAPLGATPQPTNALQAIKAAAKANNVDWRAMASIAQHESGLNPASVGDQGTSFGLFQLHQGGALPRGTNPALAKTAAWNANFAARQIKGLGIGGAMPVEEQIRQIAKRFERPADVAGEQQAALGYYRTRYAGLGPNVAAPTNSATPAAGTATGAAPSLPSLSTLTALQGAFGQTQRTNQNALDALGKLSGRSVQAAAAPDLASLMPAASSQEAPQQPAHVTVPLKGKTPEGLHPQAQKAIELAKHYLGTKYVFGGASPKTGFDCSGLIQWVHGQLGIKTPRTAAEQFHFGKPVNTKDLQPGDALFFSEDGKIGHEGMYIGNGQMIQAPHTGDVVKISPLAGHYQSILAGARRFT